MVNADTWYRTSTYDVYIFSPNKKKNSFFICHLRREGVRCQNDFFKNLVLIQIENEIILTNLLIKLTQGGGSRWRGGWRGGAGWVCNSHLNDPSRGEWSIQRPHTASGAGHVIRRCAMIRGAIRGVCGMLSLGAISRTGVTQWEIFWPAPIVI